METENTSIEHDRQLIEKLGGSAKVARLLDLDMANGVQRVNNWKTRGIPAAEKVRRPDLFMPELVQAESPPSGQRAEA